jgi:hypothetical protein
MMLVQNRSFVLETSTGERSKKKELRNGLPQGSVLAPILFNIYTADLPFTISDKFIYADDTALGFAGKTYEEIQSTLERDIHLMSHYFKSWHLKLSKPKTLCSIFHLSNRQANKKLEITLNGTMLEFKSEPVYLGITLDRSLTFAAQARSVANKTQARVNLLRKLAGTGWGASPNTLRTSALALVYSTAEYAIPVWAHSNHTSKVDVVINDALRLITGTIAPTPTSLLPVVAGIPPAHLRREYLTLKLDAKADCPGSLIPRVVEDAPPQRLDRQHFARFASEIKATHPLTATWLSDRWSEVWATSTTRLHDFIKLPSTQPPVACTGSQLPRHDWVRLNRLRTGWGNTQDFRFKIGSANSNTCCCGAVQTIEHILDCPHFKPPHGKTGIVELDEATVHWLKFMDIPV